MTQPTLWRIRTSACERTGPSAAPNPACRCTGASRHLARSGHLAASSILLTPGPATAHVSPDDPPGIGQRQKPIRTTGASLGLVQHAS